MNVDVRDISLRNLPGLGKRRTNMQQVHGCLVVVATKFTSRAVYKPGFAEFVVGPAR